MVLSQLKAESKKQKLITRMGDPKISSPEDTLFNSASSMKDLSNKIVYMVHIGFSDQFVGLPELLPSTRNSVD